LRLDFIAPASVGFFSFFYLLPTVPRSTSLYRLESIAARPCSACAITVSSGMILTSGYSMKINPSVLLYNLPIQTVIGLLLRGVIWVGWRFVFFRSIILLAPTSRQRESQQSSGYWMLDPILGFGNAYCTVRLVELLFFTDRELLCRHCAVNSGGTWDSCLDCSTP